MTEKTIYKSVYRAIEYHFAKSWMDFKNKDFAKLKENALEGEHSFSFFICRLTVPRLRLGHSPETASLSLTMMIIVFFTIIEPKVIVSL